MLCAGWGRLLQRRSLVTIEPSLAKHLDKIVNESKLLQEQIERGNFSQSAAIKLAKIAPLQHIYDSLKTMQKDAKEMQQIANDKDEEHDMRNLAQVELEQTQKLFSQERDTLLSMLVPDLEEEETATGAFLEVHAGVGGVEAGLFAQELLDMYERYVKKRRWKWELASHSSFESGGCREATVILASPEAYAQLRLENGTHRVQRIPLTEGSGRVHTSTAVVCVLPKVEVQAIEFEEGDVQTEVYRAGGAGGQHVNTTESAVRLTHIPTGIKVQCQDERSQHANRESAMRTLKARVGAQAAAEAAAKRDAARNSKLGSGSRSERIRTYNFADDRITDHRLDGSKFGLPKMFAGDLLDEFGEELRALDRKERLQEFLSTISARSSSAPVS